MVEEPKIKSEEKFSESGNLNIWEEIRLTISIIFEGLHKLKYIIIIYMLLTFEVVTFENIETVIEALKGIKLSFS